jgi:hypothetical protein
VLGADADLLEAAAWLHDIGYAPSLVATGMHSLDGARYLRDAQHADAMLCRLVARRSSGAVPARRRLQRRPDHRGRVRLPQQAPRRQQHMRHPAPPAP